jgi:lysine-specific demethylase/histidyl-hydroxylase NO66
VPQPATTTSDDPRSTPGVVGRADVERGRRTLQRLVGDVDTFLETHWARRPLLHRMAEPERVAELLSIAAVDALLAERGLRMPAVRLVRDGATLPPARITTSARIGSQRVGDLIDAVRIGGEVAGGATVSLQGLHRYWPPLTTLCRSLESVLTHPFQANAYLSPPGARGLRVHHDTHDVFVIQVEGSKHFDVYAPAIELPVSGQHWAADDPPGEPVIDVDLQPGDCLYMPRGWRHRAFTTDSPSLHLTIGLLGHTWLGLGDALTGMLRDELAFRQPLAPGFAHDPDALAGEVAVRIKALQQWLDEVDPAAVAERLTRRFVTARPPDGHGAIRTALAAEPPDEATAVRRRPDTPCLLRRRDPRVELVLPDRVVSFPAFADPVLRALLVGDPVSAAELPDTLDLASRLVVVRRLVAEGLLEPA